VVELSKIRGLIKRQEFYLNNRNVDPENKKNAPKIIEELKDKFAKIASYFKDTRQMKTTEDTAKTGKVRKKTDIAKAHSSNQ
jgi:Holliday junction resolvasome RuvABC DNA-binding subunit